MSANTVGTLLESAETQFEVAGLSYGHGTDNAFDDACVLLREAMGVPFDTDITGELWSTNVHPVAVTTFNEFVKRRITERIPTPYITGKAYVQCLTLLTDPAVIVPRSLLGEVLFAGSLDNWLADEPKQVLDLCTGSGAIAIQAALYFEGAHIDGVDIEPAAFALAHRNVALHGLESRVQVHQGDLYAPVTGKTYDIILSNPPYVNADSMATLPPEYLSEPRLALAGGTDGMDIVRRIVREAPKHLNPNGILVIEIGFEAAYFEAAFPALPFTYLSVSAGDDLVVLIEAADLNRWQQNNSQT